MPVTAFRRTAPVLALTLSLLLPTLSRAQLLPQQPPERCTSATGDARTAHTWLDRAAARVLPSAFDHRVLTYRASHDVPLWEQSDRMYGPYIPYVSMTTRWYDPTTGTEGRQPSERKISASELPAQLYTADTTYYVRDGVAYPMPALLASTSHHRLENPWIVLADWMAHADDVHIVARCEFRDAERIVLERRGERLYLSASDATPIKLERTEPHYLWGQVRAEYLWNTWWGVRGGGLYPIAAFRSFDGTLYEQVGVTPGSAALIPADSAPSLAVSTVSRPAPSPANDLTASPDTVRVAPNVWLLVTRAYTEAVTLQRDTIFLLDATTGEARARGDSAAIASLFPGRHPLVVIVTDLAWPHISGLRFQVARGATVVSHRTSEDFLRRVVERRWTLHPDALEQARASSAFTFRAVSDSLVLAGGALVVYAMRGTSTEGAVGVWVPGARFFWAGDYVQPDVTSPYVRDVVSTIRALGLAPRTVGAQHMKLTEWSALSREPGGP